MRGKAEKELDMIHFASKMLRFIPHFALVAVMLIPFASSATTVKALSSSGSSTVFSSPAVSRMRRKPQSTGFGGAKGDPSSRI